MVLIKEKKGKVVSTYGLHEKDTGSAQVQIALLTERINELSEHFKVHSKDRHSRRGLLVLVNRRRKLLQYLRSNDRVEYQKILQRLNLRK
tara:strand:- start:234 stop:503 length:270 start_codon:yes stop_codon:yes gene_type:complete